MDWIQYAEWTGTSISVENTQQQIEDNFFPYKIHTATKPEIDCDEHAVNGVVTMYLISCIIAVLFAIFQLVNMVGETLMEIKGKNLKGFQMLHGWIDSSLATFLEEIPQCILVIIFKCKTDGREIMFACLSALIGSLKNWLRFGTCKHVWKKPKSCKEYCCNESCCNESCCKESCFPLPEINCGEFKSTVPLCWIVYYTHCILCSTKKENCCYHNTKTVNPCDDCCWNRNNCCFGEIDKDPKWAKCLYSRGASLHGLLMIVLVIVKVFEYISSNLTIT